MAPAAFGSRSSVESSVSLTVEHELLRNVLLDLAELRYAHVDRGMSLSRRTEIAAGARGFSPGRLITPTVNSRPAT